MVDYQVDEHANAALLGSVSELNEITQGAERGIDGVVIGDVVAVVLARRLLKRHQPHGGDAKSMQIIEPAHEPREIANTVPVRIHIGADGEAVDNGVLVPE